jgi:hypothetical protein
VRDIVDLDGDLFNVGEGGSVIIPHRVQLPSNALLATLNFFTTSATCGHCPIPGTAPKVSADQVRIYAYPYSG